MVIVAAVLLASLGKLRPDTRLLLSARAAIWANMQLIVRPDLTAIIVQVHQKRQQQV